MNVIKNVNFLQFIVSLVLNNWNNIVKKQLQNHILYYGKIMKLFEEGIDEHFGCDPLQDRLAITRLQGDGLLEGGVGSDLAMSTDANRNGIASAVGPSYRASPGLEPPLEVSSFVHLIESAPQLSLFSSTRGIASNMPGVPRSSNSSGSGTMPSLSIEDELADAVTFGEMLRAATTAQGESSSAGEDGSR